MQFQVLLEHLFQKTKGGIYLKEAAKGNTEAVVVAVGQGFRTEAGSFIAPAVKVGDKVVLPEFGGSKVELNTKACAFSNY